MLDVVSLRMAKLALKHHLEGRDNFIGVGVGDNCLIAYLSAPAAGDPDGLVMCGYPVDVKYGGFSALT